MPGNRFLIGLVAAVTALAGLLFVAVPAYAVNATCGAPGGEFPMTPGAESAWKVDCVTPSTSSVSGITAADSGASYWHRGAARRVMVTPTNGSTTITYASGAITAADIKRPISGGCITGGAFIETAGATSGTLSAKSAATGCAAALATVEYTNSRILQDATCTAATATVGASSTVTSVTALFSAADVGDSVTGGPFISGSGARITTFTSATSVKVQKASNTGDGNAVCAANSILTIGAAHYSPSTSSTVVWNTDPMSVNLQNSTGNGQAFSCSGSVLTETAGAIAEGQNFSTAYVGLDVVVKGTTTVISKVTAATTTTLTLSVACPAGVTATAGQAGIGEPGANAPANGSVMGSLDAELNLNPSLVKTQDNCATGTFEGFQVISEWDNPLAFNATTGAATGLGFATGALASPTLVSTGETAFPTSLVTFGGFVRPQRTGGTAVVPAGSHFEYVFPSLPTSLAVCPSTPTAISLGISPTVPATLATGGGNPADPIIRALGPQLGATHGAYTLAGTGGGTGALPTCTIVASTTTPAFTCGDG